jgi:hypothetical protein
MSRQPSALVARRHEDLREHIRALKAAHPFWGDRHLRAYLRVIEQQPVNKKRRLMYSYRAGCDILDL